MRFDGDSLALLAETEEIEIETAAPGGPAHRTIIWVVVDGNEPFIRSVKGSRGRWYREALANPVVTIHADGRRLPARVQPATDTTSIERTSEALRRKYASDPALRSMLVPSILPTTLRLEPA